MKRRMLACQLVLCMVMTLFPGTALADDCVCTALCTEIVSNELCEACQSDLTNCKGVAEESQDEICEQTDEVTCIETEDCVAEIHEAGCPKYIQVEQPDDELTEEDEIQRIEESESVVDEIKEVSDADALQNAIDEAVEGVETTIVLNSDIQLDKALTIDKTVVIDGKNHKIIGETLLKNGTLKDVTLTTSDNKLLTVGSQEQNDILMENVTVKYPVQGTAAGTVQVMSGNNATIVITKCAFVNDASNDVTEDAPEWSYGMFMNEQGNSGSFEFTNNRFDGAFRTMLPNINGTVKITDNEFINRIYSNNSGSTSGAGEEATCITTANSEVNDFTITENTFDNAGAFYFQKTENVHVADNVFRFDNFEHYIQVNGKAGHALDLSNNIFELGDNNLVIIDVSAAPVLLPVGQKAVSYWAWWDTPEEIRPDDYSSYVYEYNEDGTKTFYPASAAALQAFLNPVTGNIGVEDSDVVKLNADVILLDVLEIDGKAFTIDLNGNTITAAAIDKIGLNIGKNSPAVVTLKDSKGNGAIVSPDSYKTSLICVRAGSTMTMENGIVQLKGMKNGPSSSIQTQGVLNIHDGEIVSDQAAITVIGPQANLTISGGSITGYDYAISGNGSSGLGDTTITITGGTLKQTAKGGGAIYHPQAGTLNISGDPVIEGDSGIQLCSGTGRVTNITGGMIRATGTDQRDNKTGDGFIPDGAAISIINRNYPGNTPTMHISGGYYSSVNSQAVMAYTWSNDTASDWDKATEFFTISGGYFTSDPAKYVIDGKVSMDSDKAGYAYMVGDKNSDIIIEDNATADPVIDIEDLPADLTEDDKNTIIDVAKSVDAEKALDDASMKVQLSEQTKHDAVEKAKAELNLKPEDEVIVYKQVYLDIVAKDVKKNELDGYSQITEVIFDITPKMQVVASTAKNSDDIDLDDTDGSKNAIVVSDDAQALTINGTAEITVTMPEAFKNQKVYVIHKESYVYEGTADSNGKLTFVSNHGFSPFTFTLANPIVAQIGNRNYSSLKAAVNAVDDGETMVLLKDCSETITVSEVISFKLDETSGKLTGSIEPGSKYEMSTDKDGNITIYTFKRSSSGGSSSGSSSSDEKYAISKPSKVENGLISVSDKFAEEGETITITVEPDNGYQLDKLIVTDKDGNEIKLINKGDGKFTFKMPDSKVGVEVNFKLIDTETKSENPFFDVCENDYFYDSVLWAVEKGITSGMTPDYFAPDVACTRAQMLTFLWRVNGSPVMQSVVNPFIDVSADAYYYDAVLWAVEQGITSGTSATEFSPDAIVTRGQTVTFLWRANGAPMVDGSLFADVSEDAYYADAVAWAVAEKITAGTSKDNFSPDANCTRAQTVSFLYRAME